MDKRHRLAVMLDADTLAAIDAEVRRRRMADGGRHSRASVIRGAVNNRAIQVPDQMADEQLVDEAAKAIHAADYMTPALLEREPIAWESFNNRWRAHYHSAALAALSVVREHDRNRP